MSDPRAENCRAYSQDSAGLVTGIELGITPVANALYKLYSVRLIDEVSAGGNTIATCSVVDSKGISTGEQVRLTWPGANVPFQDSGIAGNGANVHVITNPFNPPALGPLALHVGGFNAPTSDIVYGFGLPFGHHVSFVVIFIEAGAVSPDVDHDLAARLAKVEAELIAQAKAESLDDAIDAKQTLDIGALAASNLARAASITGLAKRATVNDARVTEIDQRLWATDARLKLTDARVKAIVAGSADAALVEKVGLLDGRLTALNSGYLALVAKLGTVESLVAALGIRVSEVESIDGTMLLGLMDGLDERVTALESANASRIAGLVEWARDVSAKYPGGPQYGEPING